MARKALKTPDNNNAVQRSTRVKYHVQIFTYDGFIAHNYAYMVKVIHICEKDRSSDCCHSHLC
jgi:hypothetical protein